jgi:Zinc-binding dehydrogenase
VNSLALLNFRPVVYQTFPLANADKAHALMKSSGHIGKIALVVRQATQRWHFAFLRQKAITQSRPFFPRSRAFGSLRFVSTLLKRKNICFG